MIREMQIDETQIGGYKSEKEGWKKIGNTSRETQIDTYNSEMQI